MSIGSNEWGIDTKDAVEQRFPAGRFIYWEGEEPACLYWLDSGCVAIRRADPEGHESIVRFVVPNQVFGHRARLLDHPHRSSAQALIESRIRIIEVAKIGNEFRSPLLLRRLADQLAHDLGHAEDLHHARTWHSVSQRALELFERLAEALGKRRADGGMEVDLPMPQDDLAAAIGTSPERYQEAIDELVRQERIQFEGRHLSLCDGVGRDR